MTRLVKKETTAPERAQEVRWVAPFTDVYESNDAYLIRADLPGVTSDSVDIRYEDDRIVIDARRTWFGTEDTPSVPLSYHREFALPGGVDADDIKAELANGVLTLHMPKRAEVRPRQIAVKSA